MELVRIHFLKNGFKIMLSKFIEWHLNVFLQPFFARGSIEGSLLL